jgi:hypothetical protein
MCPSPTARRLITNRRSPAPGPPVGAGTIRRAQHSDGLNSAAAFDRILVGEVGADEQAALAATAGVARVVGDQREVTLEELLEARWRFRKSRSTSREHRGHLASGIASTAASAARRAAAAGGDLLPGRYGLAMTRLASCRRRGKVRVIIPANPFSRGWRRCRRVFESFARQLQHRHQRQQEGDIVLSAPSFRFGGSVRDRPRQPAVAES